MENLRQMFANLLGRFNDTWAKLTPAKKALAAGVPVLMLAGLLSLVVFQIGRAHV